MYDIKGVKPTGSATEVIEEKIERAVKKNSMDFNGGVLLALSGGADSCALLYYLHKRSKTSGFTLYAAHLNHMIRGTEAEDDRKFCERLCEKLGVRLFLRTVDIPALSEKTGRGLEEVAREQRYAFFDELLAENPDIKNIATAHNATDNAETVIFNLLRGSGARGLSGIPPVRDGKIIRPLIFCAKSEILQYCVENSIDYVTDSTNSDTKYTRNYIRSEIIPRLGRISPSPESSISRACAAIRFDNDFIENFSYEFMKNHGIVCRADTNTLLSLHSAPLARVIAQMHVNALRKLRKGEHQDGRLPMLEQKHIEAIMALFYDVTDAGMRRISVPGGLCAVCERGMFFFEPDTRGDAEDCIPPAELHLGENYIEQADAFLILRGDFSPEVDTEYKNIYKLFIHVILSSDRINGKLYFRGRTAGDKYRCGGITRKLKKLLSDAKLPLSERNCLPVVCDGDGIVWVPGFGVRDGCEQREGEGQLHIIYAKH